MANGHDPVWTELGNVDYLLDQLARSVERGEVPLESYERLSPRYLERRAELTAIIDRRASRATAAPVPAVATQPASRPVSTPPPRAASPASQPTATPQPYTALPAQVRPTYTPRPPVEVNWTGILTGVGSLLVIVATAIFAIATWDVFSVGFKIVFLGVLTAAFYVAGELVRSRLKLDRAGIALVAVSSAMLLFDGWIVIDGYNLQGLWPWVVWLAVCSVVYWLIEMRFAGRFFGVIGAAAQVGWVWLLGQGLGWPTASRMAAIALIALAWSLAARLAKENEPLASLSQVLRYAGPIALVVSVVGVATDLAIGPATWTQVIATLIVGTCATVLADLERLPHAIAAVAHVPAFIAIASMISATGATWTHVIILVLMALGYAIHEVVRGGFGHGLIALLAEAAAWLTLSSIYDWDGDVTTAVLAALGLSWLVAARLLEPVQSPAAQRDIPATWLGIESMRLISTVGGYVLMLISTILVLVVVDVPLAATETVGRDVAFMAVMTALWVGATLARREQGPGVIVVAGAFYTTAALLGWLVPGWHSALYASALIALAGAILLASKPAARFLRLQDLGLALGMQSLSVPLLVGGIIASEYFYELQAWQVAALFATAALFWLLSALRAKEYLFGLAPAAFLASAAVGWLAWWSVSPNAGEGYLSIGAAGTALALAVPALALRGREGWRNFWPTGAALAASVAILPAFAESAGVASAAIALAACVWAILAINTIAELAVIPGLMATGALVALLAHLDGISELTVVALLVLAALQLAPSALGRARDTRLGTAIVMLAVSGISAPFALLVVGTPEPFGFGAGEWSRIGEQGVVVALLGLGAYSIVAGLLHRFEPAVIAGGMAWVVAMWAELGALDISQIEAYTVPLGLYIIWVGYRVVRGTDSAPSPIFDALATLVILAPTTLAAVSSGPFDQAWSHLLWAFGLSLLGMAVGVGLRVRAYFFGGSAAIVVIALSRSWVYLVAFWWLILGVIGVTMLVVAISWERQRSLFSQTSQRMSSALDSWR